MRTDDDDLAKCDTWDKAIEFIRELIRENRILRSEVARLQAKELEHETAISTAEPI